MAATTTLPSFVELMASLGLDPAQERSPSSSPSSSPRVPSVTPPSPSKSRSNPSLRDAAASRNRLARYSPYSPLSERRGSLSSLSSSSSDYERPTAYSTSPHPPSSPRARRRHGNNLTVNVFGSSTNLAANTPISSYVRRKTPGASPTSPSFPREPQDYSPSASPMPFSIPTLPPLFPRSASSDSFPLTPNSDIEHLPSTNSSPNPANKPLPDEERIYLHRTYHTGVRISSPPMSADAQGRYPRAQS